MTDERIRAVSFCVFSNAGRTLVIQGTDEDRLYYRPAGGGIEFFETSRDALIREVREEFDAEITDIKYLGTLENIFTVKDKRNHQVVFIFDAMFTDKSFYAGENIPVNEEGWPLGAVWKPLADFAPGRDILYPDGLFDLLNNAGKRPQEKR